MSEVSWDSNESGMSECICTICDCGKHACPVHKWQPTEFNGNSRYREDYPAHLVQPRNRAALDRSVHLTPADPDHFKSKYLEDFQAYDPDPAKSMKPKESLSASMPFTGTTTNQEVYTPKAVGPLVRRRPQSPGREQLPFDGTTTNREQFIAFPDSKPRDSMAPRQTLLASAPFDGQTCYKEDYPAHNVEGYKKKRDPHAPYDYGGPRGLETEQRASYTKKPIHVCPVLMLPKKQPDMKTGHIHYTKRHGVRDVTYSPTF
eukprot:GGOE01057272.1.p1 GENE.GGOE01057272.1~~GGOE01057272.1.p1  ORF type:complete len:267 (-),score=14.41 GGOE01057272.1:271-1050(-)